MVDLSNMNHQNAEGPIPCETYFVVYKTPEQGWVAEGRVGQVIHRLLPGRDANVLDFIHACAQLEMDIEAHRTAQAVTGMMAAMAQQAAHTQINADLAARLEADRNKGA
jgi:hypothetical protein